MTGRVRKRSGIVAALAVGAAIVLAAPAHAYMYWANDAADGPDTIARANNDGTGVELEFIRNVNAPCGVAVDGEHIYWGNAATNSIGRAKLDGSDVNVGFAINPSGFNIACGPALGGGRIWWASPAGGGGGAGAVISANLDGSDAAVQFAGPTFSRNPFGTAVGGSFVYWGNLDAAGSYANASVGQAGLDGTPPPNRTFLDTGAGNFTPRWLAADASHVYFTLDYAAQLPFGVQRVDHGKTAPIQPVVNTAATGGIALFGDTMFFANLLEGTISRVGKDGTNPDYAFIRKVGKPAGLAVDGLSTPPGELTLGKLERNKRKGTAKLAVTVNGPGSVSLAGDGLKPATVQAAASGEVEMPVKASGPKRKKLKRKGKVKLTAEVGFVPTAGTPDGESAKLKLVRK